MKRNIVPGIMEWAQQNECVKALIIQGSPDGKMPADEFADYDISVFCKTSPSYIGTEEGLARIYPVWVCVKEKVSFGG